VAGLIPMESFHQNVGEARMAALRNQALQQLIDDELEYQDGVRRGIRVPETAVTVAVRQAAAKYGGPQRFEAALRASGATMADARRELRRSLVIGKTRERSITARCQVTEAEAAQFFAKNPDRFVEPEQLHLEAITLGVDPSSPSEKWRAARAKAEAVRRELDGGAAFADLAAKYSTDPSGKKGGDMGMFHRGSLNPQFEDIARDLPLGQPSGVVETLYGYHIVRITEVRPPQRKTFAQVRVNLRKDLSTTRCKDVGDAWIKGLRTNATIVVAQ